MQVTDAMTFDEYWDDARFQVKKPVANKSAKHFFGDNIYHQVTEGHSAIQSNSHHSLVGGGTNFLNLERDIGTNRVLLSDDFIYFGKEAPYPPDELQYRDGNSFPTDARDFQKSYRSDHIDSIVSWLRSFPEWGFLGLPEAWKNPFA